MRPNAEPGTLLTAATLALTGPALAAAPAAPPATGLAAATAALAQPSPATGDEDATDPAFADAGTDGAALDARPFGGARFELVLAPWFPRHGGMVQIGTGNAPYSIEFTVDLDDSEVTPNIELIGLDDEGRQGWRASGLWFETEASGPAPNAFSAGVLDFMAGDALRAESTIGSAAYDHTVLHWRAYGDVPDLQNGDVTLDFLGYVGARWVRVEHVVEQVGTGTETGDDDWFGPQLGARFELAWRPESGLAVGDGIRLVGDFGVGAAVNNDGGTWWQVAASARWDLDDTWSVFFGYRLLELDVEDGDWIFDAGLQGLFAGAMIRF